MLHLKWIIASLFFAPAAGPLKRIFGLFKIGASFEDTQFLSCAAITFLIEWYLHDMGQREIPP